MSKYQVCIIIDASNTVEVEADSPEDAMDLAYNMDEASPSLCHQCSHDVGLAEAIKTFVYDEDGNEVLDDCQQKNEIKELEAQNAEQKEEIERLKGHLNLHDICLICGWGETRKGCGCNLKEQSEK